MKQTIKTFSLTIHLIGLMIIFCSFIKEQDNQNFLINKKWILLIESERGKTIKPSVRYTKEKKISRLDLPHTNHETEASYYLSDIKDKEFDKNKINKNKSGKFIIVNADRKDNDGNQYQEIEIWEIMELTDNYMKLKYHYNDQEFEYKAEK